MSVTTVLKATGAATLALLMFAAGPSLPAFAQEQTAAAPAGDADAASTREPLSADELEVLVARIALYPDELVAVISGAALYPLQIVEASRFLDQYAKDKTLKPKESWDGSVISLLNYPEIVKMMSDDLEWTQQLADALAYQQKDLLIAIQQLRDEAVAKGVIKSDDKVLVTQDNDNVVIKAANPDKIYVPQYAPEMLYVADYPPEPIGYYPEPYPSYYYPTATFFAGVVTGAVWAAAVDWDDWGVWGGRWNGGDIDIDCNHCFNNRDFNGKVNFNDIDWKNVDRSKINIDKNQFAKFDQTNIKNRIDKNTNNSIRNRAADINKGQLNKLSGKTAKGQDIRKSTLDGLKGKGDFAANRPDLAKPANRPDIKNAAANRPDIKKPANRPDINKGNIKKPTKVNRPVNKPRPAARPDNRPRKPSGLGNVDRGKPARVNSNRGARSMGGGMHGGGGHRQRGGGGRGGGGRRR